MSIFDQSEDTISLEEFQISHEMIAPQLDDPVKAQLEQEVDYIIEFLNKRKIKANQHEKAMKDIEYKGHIEKLEQIISKRFGFNTRIFDGGAIGTPAACLPVGPKEFNVLGQRIYSDVHTEIEKEKEKVRVKTQQENEYYSKYDLRVEFEAYEQACNTFKAMNEVMNTKGFKVDLENAKIIGLPEKFSMVLIFNFAALVANYGFNTRQIVAIILHEVGHCFTHLECSYRYLSNTTVLITTFLENLAKKNKTPRESFTIAYKKVTKDSSIDKLKDTNNLTFYITTGGRLTDFMSNTSSPHYSVDSEQQADQFAGRFGYGEELATALNIMMKKGTGILSMLLYATIAVLSIVLAVLVPMLAYLFGTIGLAFILLLYNIIFKKNNVYGKYIYDDDKQRLVRIRNEVVRLIRSSNLDKDTIDSLLGNIEVLDYTIDNMREGWVGPIDKIYQTFFPGGKRKLEIRTIEETVERLMENDLHIAKHKIKKLSS